MSNLLEFYGAECPYCIHMQPIIAQLEKEFGVKVERFEVWYDAANRARMAEYDRGFCGGVPFFYNTATKQWICGAASYEELKKWAMAE